jgi:hypothetical protein
MREGAGSRSRKPDAGCACIQGMGGGQRRGETRGKTKKQASKPLNKVAGGEGNRTAQKGGGGRGTRARRGTEPRRDGKTGWGGGRPMAGSRSPNKFPIHEGGAKSQG